MAILFIPVYTYEPVMKNVPNAVILLIGVLAVVIIIVRAPVESINKPLDEEERKYYARVTPVSYTHISNKGGKFKNAG